MTSEGLERLNNAIKELPVTDNYKGSTPRPWLREHVFTYAATLDNEQLIVDAVNSFDQQAQTIRQLTEALEEIAGPFEMQNALDVLRSYRILAQDALDKLKAGEMS